MAVMCKFNDELSKNVVLVNVDQIRLVLNRGATATELVFGNDHHLFVQGTVESVLKAIKDG